jgi:ATP-dependent Clp protease ATP-binding subunit ClpC
MPKINVYVPDDLAAQIRESRIPVSAVCQKALAEAVTAVGRARKVIELLQDPEVDLAGLGGHLEARMTPRLRTALGLAAELSGGRNSIQTKHLLAGVLDEGDNLGFRILRSFEVDPDELRRAAFESAMHEEAPRVKPPAKASFWGGLSVPAREAIASALGAAIDWAHNYLGCEHLLLGLLRTEHGGACIVLHDAGVGEADVRRAISSAVTGFAHAQTVPARSQTSELDAVLRRLEAVERHLGMTG